MHYPKCIVSTKKEDYISIQRVKVNKSLRFSSLKAGVAIKSPGSQVIKLVSCSTQLSMTCIMLIILKCQQMLINSWHFNIYEHSKYDSVTETVNITVS